MDYTGIASVTFAATDLGEARRYLSDWGLARARTGRRELRGETRSGSTVIVVAAGSGEGAGFREVIYGVATAAQRDAIAAELARDRQVLRDDGGTVRTVDDCGFPIGFRVWKPRRSKSRPAPTRWNAPAARSRIDREAVAFGEGAQPGQIGHIVFAVNDVARAEAFYRDRLGFWLSDRYVGGAGVFLRWARRSEHHNVFFLKSRSGRDELHHLAFEVDSVHEVFGGGLAFSRAGWKTQIGPGRHPISSAYFWYFVNPMGGAFEYFCDPDYVTERWKPRNFRVNRFSEWHLPAGLPTASDGHARPSLATARAIEAEAAARASAR